MLFVLYLLFIFFIDNILFIKKIIFLGKLTDSFEISRLYYSPNNDKDYSTTLPDNNKFDIIGIIEIKSLGLNYPILSNYSDEFLKIAPCRIAGPSPNEVGNLCIAAHNYNNSTFFSKISLLNISDIITIYDISGNSIDYEVYENKEVNFDDLNCLSQDNVDKKELTLLTCNNSNANKRIIIKAKEKE